MPTISGPFSLINGLEGDLSVQLDSNAWAGTYALTWRMTQDLYDPTRTSEVSFTVVIRPYQCSASDVAMPTNSAPDSLGDYVYRCDGVGEIRSYTFEGAAVTAGCNFSTEIEVPLEGERFMEFDEAT